MEKQGNLIIIKLYENFCLLSLSPYHYFNVTSITFKFLIETLVGFLFNTEKICFSSQPKKENEFDVLTTHLLDNSAAKHKISVKPKKNHSSSHLHKNVSPQSQSEFNTNDKYVYQ